ncbi:MAG: type II secretion system F family protein [Gammaproteobacteria bacterium]|nr:type II secretion system F family protein [Gammaproteobacteria bacterium]
MSSMFLDLIADSFFLITAGCVFASGFMLWLFVLLKGREQFSRYQERFTSTAQATMGEMFLFIDPQKLFQLNVALVIVVPLLCWLVLRDFSLTLGVFLLLLILPGMVWKSMKARYLRRFERQLPDGLLMVAGSLRAGASLSIALESLVREQQPPLAREFELFLNEQRVGVDFDVSLANMEQRLPLPDFGMLVTALRINREVGGNLATTIESLGETLRRKSMMEGKIKSLTAQGKMQGYVMAGLPILLAVVLNIIEPAAMSKLWTTNIGYVVLGIGFVMEVMGFLMISKITRIDV